MKKAAGIDDLASRLTQAANAPLVQMPSVVQEQPATRSRSKAGDSVSVFLRMPRAMHARIEAEAMARTRETGRGVTVQQIILEKLASDV